jgi:hypothetical protein
MRSSLRVKCGLEYVKRVEYLRILSFAAGLFLNERKIS